MSNNAYAGTGSTRCRFPTWNNGDDRCKSGENMQGGERGVLPRSSVLHGFTGPWGARVILYLFTIYPIKSRQLFLLRHQKHFGDVGGSTIANDAAS